MTAIPWTVVDPDTIERSGRGGAWSSSTVACIFASREALGRKCAVVSANAPSGPVAAYSTPAPGMSKRLPARSSEASAGLIWE